MKVKVERIMRHTLRTCCPSDSLNDAARIMWEEACGSVPVVDEQFRPVGLVTDRDICMAAYTQGALLRAMRVESAMARRIVSCYSNDEIAEAARLMRENGVRRLPVVDAAGKLVGLLSLDDLACESQHSLRGGVNSELTNLIGDTYGSICHTRCRRPFSTDPPQVGASRRSR